MYYNTKNVEQNEWYSSDVGLKKRGQSETLRAEQKKRPASYVARVVRHVTCPTYLVEISKVRQVPLPQQVFFRSKRLQLRGNTLGGCASTSLPRIALAVGGSAGSGTSLATNVKR